MLHSPLNHQQLQSRVAPVLAPSPGCAEGEAPEAAKLLFARGDLSERVEAPPLATAAASLGGVRTPPSYADARWPGLIVAALGYALAVGASFTWQSGLSGQAVPVFDDPIEVEVIIEPPAEASHEPMAVTEVIREDETKAEIAPAPADAPPEPLLMTEAETPQPALPPPMRREPVKAAKAQQPSKQAKSGNNASLIDAYRLQVAAQIARNKPANSFAAAAQGVALVSFRIDRNGQADSIKLTQSSGNFTLDQEAVATIKRSSPFPAPPMSSGREFTVPIRFRTGN